MSLLLCMLAAGLMLSSCKKENKTPDTSTVSDLNLQGHVKGTLTLDAAKAYTLVGSFYVDEGATLTIPMHDGLKIRRGAKVKVTNALIKGTGHSAVSSIIGLTDGKGDAADGCSFQLAYQGIDFVNELKATDPAKHTLTKDASLTGCPQNIFAWTGYSF